MGAPNVSFVIQSTNLGQTGAGGQANQIVVIGDSSGGTANQPYQSPVPQNFVNQFGYGKGPQLAALIAAMSGKSVVFVKATSPTAGSNTAVIGRLNTATGAGTTSSSAITLTGTPYDDYMGLITVLAGGTIGANGIQLGISLDNGTTTVVTANLLTASTYAIANTGLTLNFGAGTLVTGDQFVWLSTAPLPNTTTTQAAICSLIGKGIDIEDILVPWPACASDVATLQTYVAASPLFNAKQFCRCLTESRDVVQAGACAAATGETESTWIASLQAAFSATAADHVGVGAGFYRVLSVLDGTWYRRNIIWPGGVRDASVPISVDMGRTKDGPLAPLLDPNLTSSPEQFFSGGPNVVYHDEAVNPGLDASRFITGQSIPGLPGLYVVNPNLMAPPGSVFNWLTHAHVCDKFCKILYQFFALSLSDSVRVSASTGFILPADAADLVARCQANINAGLVYTGDVSAASVAIVLNNNILATNQLLVTGTIVPLAYFKSIVITVAFVNPATTQVP